MKFFNKPWLILIILTILGASLRFAKISQIPEILNRDEAAIGYNAFLISNTSMDEWGQKLPLLFKSFGDYKLPGYIYSVAVLFEIFEPADWVVKLPSLLAGVALIPISFLFSRSLKQNLRTSLIVAALVCISPIFFFYSRIGYEANLGLVLMVSGLVCLLSRWKSASKRLIFDLLGLFLLSLATITYNTPFLLLPFLVVPLILSRYNLGWRRWIVPVLGILLIFGVWFQVTKPITAQKSNITVFDDAKVRFDYLEYRSQLNPLELKLRGSKPFYFFMIITQRTVASFSPSFLVFDGGQHPWHYLGGYSHFSLATYLLAAVGIWVHIETTFLPSIKKLKLKNKATWIFWWLLFAGLAPAVITVDAPHTTRSLLFLLMIAILAAVGIEQVIRQINSKLPIALKRNLIVLPLTIILLLDLSNYYRSYFTEFSNRVGGLFPGLEPAIEEVTRIHLKDPDFQNKKILFVDPSGYHPILTAWYSKIEPKYYFSTVKHQLPDQLGFEYTDYFGPYHFVGAQEDQVGEVSAVILWDKVKKQWLVSD